MWSESERVGGVFVKIINLEYISNFIISFLFLIHHNRILSRAVVYKKAFDISRKRSHPRPTPTTQQNHKNTNPRVSIFFIVFIKLYEYCNIFF